MMEAEEGTKHACPPRRKDDNSRGERGERLVERGNFCDQGLEDLEAGEVSHESHSTIHIRSVCREEEDSNLPQATDKTSNNVGTVFFSCLGTALRQVVTNKRGRRLGKMCPP